MKKSILILISLLLIQTAIYSQFVYKTPSGLKYHLASCKSVKNSSEQLTIAAAQKGGLTPCKICKPPVIFNTSTPSKKANGEDRGVQCKGFTKKKTRCKHFTKIGNGFCFQHQ